MSKALHVIKVEIEDGSVEATLRINGMPIDGTGDTTGTLSAKELLGRLCAQLTDRVERDRADGPDTQIADTNSTHPFDALCAEIADAERAERQAGEIARGAEEKRWAAKGQVETLRAQLQKMTQQTIGGQA